MEPGLLFTTLVLAVGVFHLISNTSSFLAKKMTKSKDHTTTQKVVRDDWYMFFNCSDLTGKEKKAEAAKNPPLATNRKNTTDRRRRAVQMR